MDLSDVVAYHPASNRWRSLAPMPSARFRHVCVWTGNRLLIRGGVGVWYPSPRFIDGAAFQPA